MKDNRLLVERPLLRDGRERERGQGRENERGQEPGQGRGVERGVRRKAARSVTVNLAESPLGWLLARGMITRRQSDAGERLRSDWEAAQLAPSVTMRWDAPPAGRVARGAPAIFDPTTAQLHAKKRFEVAVKAAGPGLSDILWRIVCSGEGMRDAEVALGWPARAGRIVLGLALDRLAYHYRIR